MEAEVIMAEETVAMEVVETNHVIVHVMDIVLTELSICMLYLVVHFL